MEIVEGEALLISNYEVSLLLEEHRKKEKSFELEAMTIEYETFAYLNDLKYSPVSLIKSEQAFEGLMKYLASLKLTKLERLQIVNLLPRSVIDFYVIVEECEERFETQMIEEEILPKIQKEIPQLNQSD